CGIVGGSASRVGAGAPRNPRRQHRGYGWSCLRGLCSIALDKVIALVGHPMLDRDAAAQRRDTIDVAPVNGFAMVEKPVDAFERNIAVDLLVNVQRAPDRLVVCCVQTPGPAVLREHADDLFEFSFHVGRHFWARDLEAEYTSISPAPLAR